MGWRAARLGRVRASVQGAVLVGAPHVHGSGLLEAASHGRDPERPAEQCPAAVRVGSAWESRSYCPALWVQAAVLPLAPGWAVEDYLWQ